MNRYEIEYNTNTTNWQKSTNDLNYIRDFVKEEKRTHHTCIVSIYDNKINDFIFYKINNIIDTDLIDSIEGDLRTVNGKRKYN